MASGRRTASRMAAAGALTGGAWGVLDHFIAGTQYSTAGAYLAAMLFSAALFGLLVVTAALLATPVLMRMARGARVPSSAAVAIGVGLAVLLYGVHLINSIAFPRSGFSDPGQTGADLVWLFVVAFATHRTVRRVGARSGPENGAFLQRSGLVALVAWPTALAFLLWPAGGGEIAGQERPNVLLISIDTLRADHLSCYGYERETSPNLDALARQGFFARRAYSQSSHSLSSHASMLTGLYPHEHGALSPGSEGLVRPIPSGVWTLPEILSAEGYVTGGFVNNPWLGEEFGFSQGFDDYVNGAEVIRLSNFDPNYSLHASILGDYWRKISGAAAGGGIESVRLARVWIRRHAGRPFFCFLHIIEPHSPYSAPAPYARMFSGDYSGGLELDIPTSLALAAGRIPLTEADHEYVISQYDGEIRYVDAAVGEVLATLDELDLAERTLVIVTSDHGEVMRHHRPLFSHHGTFEACTRVPLIFRFPGMEAQSPVESVVESVDIVPTVLDYLLLAHPYSLQGNSLWPLPFEAPRRRKDYAVLTTNAGDELALRTRDWKLVVDKDGEVRLVTPDDDPREATDHSSEEPVLVAEMRAVLDRWREKCQEKTAGDVIDLTDLDDATLEKLRSLGYWK